MWLARDGYVIRGHIEAVTILAEVSGSSFTLSLTAALSLQKLVEMRSACVSVILFASVLL